MPDSNCPSRQQLLDYLARALPDEAAAVGAHVDQCPACQATLASLSDPAVSSPPDPSMAPRALPAVSAFEPSDLGQLGEYELLEELGRGGMGVVYRARHTELDRVVAVKILPAPRLGDDQAEARFQREIKAAGQLDHPHIVRAYDARQIRSTRFLVMEFVSGVDLGELVHRLGPVAVGDACQLVRQAALGLQCAHEHGLVHRDLKPSNLMLSRTGVVKILDLGLARFSQAPPTDNDVTIDGQTLGTPDYMAPEQAANSHEADIRSDLYSLGCTLHFLLAGQSPFCGSGYLTPFDKMMAHVNERIPSLRTFRGDLPDELLAVFDQMVAKQPADRFETPAALADALEPFVADADLRRLAASAEGQSPTQRLQAATTMRPITIPSERRHRPWVIAAAGLGLLLVAALVFSLLDPVKRSPGDSSPDVMPTPSAVVPGEIKLRGWIVLSWTLPGTGKPDLWLFRPDGSQRAHITDDPRAFDVHPTFSPDGRRIAFIRGLQADRSNSVWICNVDGTSPRRVIAPTENSERFISPVWISDTRLCYVRDPGMDRWPDMELWEIDIDDESPRRVFGFADTGTNCNGLITDVSPDGMQFAIVAQNGWLWPTANIYVSNWKGENFQTVWRDDPDDRKDARPLWSPNGQRIAWHHNFTRGALADRFLYGVGFAELGGDGQWTVRLQPQRETRTTPLAWAPDGDGLLCARMSPDETLANLFVMDEEFFPTRELFELPVHAWQPGHRDFGRLADWAIVPADAEPDTR